MPTAMAVLLVDPAPERCPELAALCTERAVRMTRVSNARQALAAMDREVYEAVFITEDTEADAGLALATRVASTWPDALVFLAAETPTVQKAVAAVRAGAQDLLTYPLDAAQLSLALSRVRPPPNEEETPPRSTLSVSPVIGSSKTLQEVLARVGKVAAGHSTVLIRGESGTGKEVLARRIHELSPRRTSPFVKINSAALPEQLLESELFGHEKGAFTGATTRKPGRLELAEGGTLFLDEIGDISAATQVKLLRVLQEKEYESVGGTKTIKANVRFLAATHKPLEEMVEEGSFREDLYYRLNVVPIVAPPLRERPDDVAPLVRHFCQQIADENGQPLVAVEEGAMTLLAGYEWPGNVRQLQNVVERLVVLSDTLILKAGIVQRELTQLRLSGRRGKRSDAPPEGRRRVGELTLGATVVELDEAVRRAEQRALERALDKAGGNRTLAARILGISRRTLYNKLAEHGIG